MLKRLLKMLSGLMPFWGGSANRRPAAKLCLCGAGNNPAENTPEAFLDFIRNSSFDRSSLRPWERETLSSYLGPDRAKHPTRL